MRVSVLALLLVFAFNAQAAKEDLRFTLTKEEVAANNFPVEAVKVKTFFEAGALDHKAIAKLEVRKFDENRRPAQAFMHNQSDALKKFTQDYLKLRDGYAFYKLIKEYDDNYENYKNAPDLQYVILRLATMLPMKGVVWRVVPLVHTTVITQEMLLAQMKNMGEILMIQGGDTHVQAQLAFFTMPFPDLVVKGDVPRYASFPWLLTKNIYTKRFYVEQDIVNFLMTEVYPSLGKAVLRLQKLQESGVEIVFDAKIRFGDRAFNEGKKYDDHDRYRVIGQAEMFAQLARYHRRASAIMQMGSYNFMNYVAMTKKIGNLYGMDTWKSGITDMLRENIYVEGVDRRERVQLARSYTNLFKLISAQNMKNAYAHLAASVGFLEKTWAVLEKRSTSTNDFALLDAEVLQGRKEQVAQGIENLGRLVRGDPKEGGGQATILGELSGDPLKVNVYAFFHNPPKDLKNLLATGFQDNKDVDGLKAHFKDMKPVSGRADMFTMTVGDQTVEWRNYLFDRAVRWDTSKNAFGELFPGVTDVARARRIVGETRGARFLASNIMLWVK